MNVYQKPIILVGIFFAALAFIYLICTRKGEDFIIGPGKIRYSAPYYTTTFQAYPGRYMEYGSGRHWKCLQQNQTYPGYRNCMLYFA